MLSMEESCGSVCVLTMLPYEFPVENKVTCRLNHPLFILHWQYILSKKTSSFKMSHLSDIKRKCVAITHFFPLFLQHPHTIDIISLILLWKKLELGVNSWTLACRLQSWYICSLHCSEPHHRHVTRGWTDGSIVNSMYYCVKEPLLLLSTHVKCFIPSSSNSRLRKSNTFHLHGYID